ncbi:5'-nucleotidase C-terminal domain-containing protein [Saliterribacillus persicus]|uniref:2',3'-cyclic-nucleotide 2'-phosphodiesterase (5'-nucleotidase family) n=1 Tax=Saliterribacillus persicus TaxID=930114 RepID=A0A368XD66_9BACI|nr:5'-nucleotidase C-terminal domain-containing protein [Saliterribacillus persicus]RCW65890.1 2',3'-cyclic-nucleotide 2'-phosphodiesterase (5'-nucleotidase family) [Saliterribacillus persicus]
MRHLPIRKFFSSFLVAILILASFSNAFIPVVNAEENGEPLTVAEALELEHGTGVTLEGYIVEPTNGQYAIKVADSVEDTSTTIVVKLEPNQRDAFSPENNSDALGKEILVTGERDTYSNQESIEYVSSIEFVDSTGSDEDFLTVSKTLELEQGVEATVKGFIVEGLNGIYAMKLSDSVEDTSTTLNVKLEVDQRDIFSPELNPNALGQEVIVTGETGEYYGEQALENVSSIEFVDPSVPSEPEEPEEPIDAIDISDARALGDGQLATIEGTVLASPSAIGNGQYNTYIQDNTAGINIFSYEQGDFPSLNKGDKVKVSGELETYNGLKEILPSTVEIIDQDQSLPEPQLITLAEMTDGSTAEKYEGELVEVNGYITNIPDSPAGGGYNISIVDEDFNGTTLRVMEGSLDISALEEGNWYDVTAIMSQYNSYQLIPTEASDITLADEQPEAPTAAGEYTSTVMYVTDGDTIRLETPVLGADRVRFVNIDTPETDMGSANGAHGDNQDQHGDAATEYLQTLLPEGEEVTLKIGSEPTDPYGRLLAQVINKDGINTNLEMVKQGYASSYFIWPVGNEEEYETYQAATREAKDNERGIWDPADPLIEQPFEYRAILEGGDFSRYVGHSDTKEYVEPLEWAEVPVDKRIFFASAQEAEAQGYTAVDDEGSDPVDPPSANILELQLLSMNDLHGKIDQEYELDLDGDGEVDGMFGRMDYTSAFIKDRAEDNPNTLIVHAGDMIGGSSPVSGLYQDEPTVEIMEEIGFDFGTVGNHEFDEGTDELLRMVNGGEHPEGLGTADYDGMNFDNLCANCVYKDSGETILPPYAVAEVDGEKIGFIGVNTQASANMVMPAGIEDIEFTDEATAVNEAVAELQADGVEAIVVLAHMPATQNDSSATGDSANLANNVDDAVDIIYAAHNHEVVDAIVDNKLIVQASEYGKAFADVDIEIDRETGDIVNKEAEIVFVDQSEMEPDPAVTGILEKYDDLISDKMNEVLGYNANTMTGSYTGDGDHGLGNLIADAMKWSMDSDFAMMNGGGIRDHLLEGEVTWGELYNVMPFGNTLMEFEVTGADIYDIIDEQISAQYGPDYSVSGLKYTWDSSTFEAIDIMFMDGTLIDEDETYTLAVNNYMGTSAGPIKDLGKNEIMGPVDLDSFVNYVKHLDTTEENPINIGPEGRIVEVDTGSGDELGEVTIADARDAEPGTEVTVEGIVTTTPGAWGSDGFYMQDETGGTYVFGDESVNVGDTVKLTAKTASYNGEFQLSSVSELVITGSTDIPTPIVLSPAGIDDSNQGELVILKGAKISGLEEVNDYGTFEFTATKDGETILVRVDNRTGLAFSNFTFEDGDIVDVSGISSVFNGVYQLKPTKAADIVEHIEEPEPEEQEQVVIKPAVSNGKATIDTANIDKVKDQGELIVDVEEEEEIELELTTDQIKKLKLKDAKLIISAKLTSLSIPSSVLPDGDVTIKVKEVTDVEGAIGKVFDFTINGGEVHEFSEPVTLKFFVGELENENVEVRYYNEEMGEWKSIGGTYSDGTVTAETEHFSIFGVFEIAEGEEIPGTGDDNDSGDESEETPGETGSEDSSDGSDESDESDETPGETDSEDSSGGSVVEKESGDSLDEKLPETASNMFNLLLLGSMFILAGLLFYYYQRRRII